MKHVLPLVLLSACTVIHHPQTVLPAGQPSQPMLEALASPGVIQHEAVLSATWEAPLSGLLNLDRDPASQIEDRKVPFAIPVHVLEHPTAGVFIVDTGISAEMAEGGRGPARGVARMFLKSLVPAEPLADILERQQAPLSGVLLTHLHLDHVLGLNDVPPGTPIYAGPDEMVNKSLQNFATRPTHKATLRGHDALSVWNLDDAQEVEGLRVVDVVGDGSLWAVHVPGHTPGSMAYLANTPSGPQLFTGDTSHTRWGWDHGVEPGTYSEDNDANAASLAALRALAERLPALTVYVGHEVAEVTIEP